MQRAQTMYCCFFWGLVCVIFGIVGIISKFCLWFLLRAVPAFVFLFFRKSFRNYSLFGPNWVFSHTHFCIASCFSYPHLARTHTHTPRGTGPGLLRAPRGAHGAHGPAGRGDRLLAAERGHVRAVPQGQECAGRRAGAGRDRAGRGDGVSDARAPGTMPMLDFSLLFVKALYLIWHS